MDPFFGPTAGQPPAPLPLRLIVLIRHDQDGENGGLMSLQYNVVPQFMAKAQKAIYQAKQPETKLVLVNVPISSIPSALAISSAQFDFVQVWASMFEKHELVEMLKKSLSVLNDTKMLWSRQTSQQVHLLINLLAREGILVQISQMVFSNGIPFLINGLVHLPAKIEQDAIFGFLRSPGSARIFGVQSADTDTAHDSLGRGRENVPPAIASTAATDLNQARLDASGRAHALDTDARHRGDPQRTDLRAIPPNVPPNACGQDTNDHDTRKDGGRGDSRDETRRDDLHNRTRADDLRETRGDDLAKARRDDSCDSSRRGDLRDRPRCDDAREQPRRYNSRDQSRRDDLRDPTYRGDSRSRTRRDDVRDQTRRDDSREIRSGEIGDTTRYDDPRDHNRRHDLRDRHVAPTSSDRDRAQPARPNPCLNQDAASPRALLTARRAESTAARPWSRSRSPPPSRSNPRSRSRSPAWRGRHARSPSPPPRKRTESRQYEEVRSARVPSPRDRYMRSPSPLRRRARAHETEERSLRSARASRRSLSPSPRRTRSVYPSTSDRIATESSSRRTSTEPSTRRDNVGTSRCRSRSPPRHRRRDDRSRSPPPAPYGGSVARSTRNSDSAYARSTYSNHTTTAGMGRRGNWTNSYTPSSRSLAGSTTLMGSPATSVRQFNSKSPRHPDMCDTVSPAMRLDSTKSECDVQEPPRVEPVPFRVAYRWPRLTEIAGADITLASGPVPDRARARPTSAIDIDNDADSAMGVVEQLREQGDRDATVKRATFDVDPAARTEPEPQRVASGWPPLAETASSIAAPAVDRTRARLPSAPDDESDDDIAVVECVPPAPAPAPDDRAPPAPAQRGRQVHGLLLLAEPTRSASRLTPLDSPNRAKTDAPAAPSTTPPFTPASQDAAATPAVTAAFSAYAKVTATTPAAPSTSGATTWASRILNSPATTTPSPATRVLPRAALLSYVSRSETTSPTPPSLASTAASSTSAWFSASAAPAPPPAPTHLPAYGAAAHAPASGTPFPPPYSAPAAAARVASPTPPPAATPAIQRTNHVPLKIYPASIFVGNQGQFKSKLEEYVKIPEHHGLLSKPEYTIIEAAGGQAGPFGCRLVLAAPEARYVFEVPTVHSKKKSAEQAVAEIAMRALNLVGGMPRAPPAAAVPVPAAVPLTVMHVPARTPSPAVPAAVPSMTQFLDAPLVANVQYTLTEIGSNFVGKLNEHAQKCGWAAPTYLEDRERADGAGPRRHRMKLRVNGTSYVGPWVELQSTTMRAKQAAAKMVMYELELIRGGGR
ncbi:hypothetical protein GGF31_000825 [Allomyces arbusculus]|nr:hypothetical protein GGF31_000825 [Allomyces arbusculus]